MLFVERSIRISVKSPVQHLAEQRFPHSHSMKAHNRVIGSVSLQRLPYSSSPFFRATLFVTFVSLQILS